MTLDPIHVENIARLAYGIAGDVDTTDHDDLAGRVWRDWLPELRRDGRVVIEPVGDHERRLAPVDDAALAERPFETVHGLDSGTINPTTFKNGLVVDVAHAAMASEPTDLDLHRDRTIVATVHAGDSTADFDDDWRKRDDGHTRQRVLHAPRVNRYAEGVVHALALYLAEGTHALDHADEVDDLLVLDGPIYPKELFTWDDRNPELGALAREAKPRAVVEKYVRLVERFVERDVPLIGFIKNSGSSAITRAVRDKTNAPWANDNAFFNRVLARRDDEGDLRTGALTFTNWFHSRVGTDRIVADDALGIERALDPELYEVTFFVVYDPRDDLCYRVEAPYAFTRDEELRERLRMQVLHEVAAEQGPPLAVAKADELARIDAGANEQLRRRIERELDSERHREYDDKRWGVDVDEMV